MIIKLKIADIEYLTDVLETLSMADLSPALDPSVPQDIKRGYTDYLKTSLSDMCVSISVALSNPVVSGILFHNVQPGQSFDVSLSDDQRSFLLAILPDAAPAHLRALISA